MTGWTMYKWWEEKEEEKKWIQANAIANSWEGWVWATGKDKKMNELSQRFWHEIRGTIVQVLHLQPAPIKAVPSSRKPNLQCYFFFLGCIVRTDEEIDNTKSNVQIHGCYAFCYKMIFFDPFSHYTWWQSLVVFWNDQHGRRMVC